MGHIAAICDKDTIVAVAGASKREQANGAPLSVGKAIHQDVEQIMLNREKVNSSSVNGNSMVGITISDEENEKFTAQIILPILSSGDAIGAVMLLSKEPGIMLTQTDFKVAETAANFMGRQLEN